MFNTTYKFAEWNIIAIIWRLKLVENYVLWTFLSLIFVSIYNHLFVQVSSIQFDHDNK